MNIYIEFKKELGYVDVVNQYIELLHRDFLSDFVDKKEYNKKVSILSEKYNLNLTAVPYESLNRLPKMYIIAIHSAFNCFLNNYKRLDGSPVQSKEIPNGKDLLTFVMDENGLLLKGEKVECLYRICDLYRCARNCIIHKSTDKEKRSFEKAYKKLVAINYFQIFKGNLKIASKIDELSFDDQVLFSMTVDKLAEMIYYNSDYNYWVYIKKNSSLLRKRMCKFLNKKHRMINYLNGFLRQYYPSKKYINNDNLEDVIKMIQLEH